MNFLLFWRPFLQFFKISFIPDLVLEVFCQLQVLRKFNSIFFNSVHQSTTEILSNAGLWEGIEAAKFSGKLQLENGN